MGHYHSGNKRIKITVEIGSEFVGFRREHNSRQNLSARILGREVKDGIEYIYLDRLVDFGTKAFVLVGGWTEGGAISIILTRSVRAAGGASPS